MPLTPESQVVLDVLAKQGVKALDELPPAEGRAYFNVVFKTKPEDQEACARVEELSIPVAGGTIPARLYAPATRGPVGRSGCGVGRAQPGKPGSTAPRRVERACPAAVLQGDPARRGRKRHQD